MTPEFTLDELETPQLKLRKLTIDDAAQLALLRSDERVNRYLDRPASTSFEEAVQFVNKILSSNSYYWAISRKNEIEFVGTVCLWNVDHENSVVEIGYELLPEFHGQGIMIEVIPAIIAYNSSVLQFATIIGTTHIENIPSINLLKKNNFIRDETRENQLHKEGGSPHEIVYSLNTNKGKFG